MENIATSTIADISAQPLSDYEIERGKPLPTTTHGAIQFNLSFLFKFLFGKKFRGVSELSLDTLPKGTTPDLAFYPFFELEFGDEPARNPNAPLICIEIQSPSQSLEEMVAKTKVYFEFGVQSCWIVLPAVQSVLVFSAPGEHEYFHKEEMVQDEKLGLEIPLKRIFE